MLRLCWYGVFLGGGVRLRPDPSEVGRVARLRTTGDYFLRPKISSAERSNSLQRRANVSNLGSFLVVLY